MNIQDDEQKQFEKLVMTDPRTKRPALILVAMLAVCLLLLSFPGQSAYASEYGWSSYTPGTYGEFSMNYAVPGLYFRENIIYYGGKFDNYPIVDPATLTPFDANLKQKTWFNLLAVSYIASRKILGAHYFIGGNAAYGFSTKLDMEVPGIFAQNDKTSGRADIWLAPIGLMWNLGNFHITLAEAVVLPTGRYDKNNLVSMGRNYYSYETNAGMTWLDEKNGHEISLSAGYIINSRNKDTDYLTGNEFHLDYAVNQFFSENFAIGITGYYYKQMQDDSGPSLDAINQINTLWGLPAPGGFRSESAGVGPTIMLGLSKNVQFIAKWIHDYHAKNRFKGDWAFFSITVMF